MIRVRPAASGGSPKWNRTASRARRFQSTARTTMDRAPRIHGSRAISFSRMGRILQLFPSDILGAMAKSKRSKDVRVAFIGTGRPWRTEGSTGFGMAYAHADGYNKIPGVRLVACADLVKENAEAF